MLPTSAIALVLEDFSVTGLSFAMFEGMHLEELINSASPLLRINVLEDGV